MPVQFVNLFLVPFQMFRQYRIYIAAHRYILVRYHMHQSVLKTFLPDSKRFRRELSAGHKALFRSTIFPADKALVRGSNLNEIIDEILELIQ